MVMEVQDINYHHAAHVLLELSVVPRSTDPQPHELVATKQGWSHDWFGCFCQNRNYKVFTEAFTLKLLETKSVIDM